MSTLVQLYEKNSSEESLAVPLTALLAILMQKFMFGTNIIRAIVTFNKFKLKNPSSDVHFIFSKTLFPIYSTFILYSYVLFKESHIISYCKHWKVHWNHMLLSSECYINVVMTYIGVPCSSK